MLSLAVVFDLTIHVLVDMRAVAVARTNVAYQCSEHVAGCQQEGLHVHLQTVPHVDDERQCCDCTTTRQHQ